MAAEPVGVGAREKNGSRRDHAVQRARLKLSEFVVGGAVSRVGRWTERRATDASPAFRSTVRNAPQGPVCDGRLIDSSIGGDHPRFFIGPLTTDEMRAWYFISEALDAVAARGTGALPLLRRPRVADRIQRFHDAPQGSDVRQWSDP
jgi:hypothetical protein